MTKPERLPKGPAQEDAQTIEEMLEATLRQRNEAIQMQQRAEAATDAARRTSRDTEVMRADIARLEDDE